jgi:HSP20 family protein
MDLIPRDFFTNDLLEDFMEAIPKKHQGMKCDIYEKDGIYHVEMDIPGTKKEDIKIETEDGYMTISVTKNEELEDSSKNYIRKERRYGCYERRFYIGYIDDSSIKAEFKDGVLNVSFPESKSKTNKKNIEID